MTTISFNRRGIAVGRGATAPAILVGAALKEQWKQIPGYPGYEVSDQGRVRSVDRYVETSNGQRRFYRGRMLRPGRSSNGYLTVALGAGNSRCVHELVLLAFVGPCPAGHLAYHEDDVREHNELSNLRWGTPRENSKNITRLGKRMFTYEEAETIKKKN